MAIESPGAVPRLLAPWLERRASGHKALIEGAAARVNRWLVRADRGAVLEMASVL